MKFLIFLLFMTLNMTVIAQKVKCTSGDCNNGNGVKIFPDGSTYKGQFKNGKYHGKGILTNKNKIQTYGHWKMGIQHGKSKTIAKNGDIHYCTYENGKIVGDCSVVKNNISNSNSTIEKYGILKDSRDRKEYKTVLIGNQTWMAENLAYKPQKGNFWAYNNTEGNVFKLGYLYDWKTAQTICPNGWHLPSKKEWLSLVSFLGGHEAAGKSMKSKADWEYDQNGSNESGFNGYPAGNRFNAALSFSNLGYLGGWWSSFGSEGKFAVYFSLIADFMAKNNSIIENNNGQNMSFSCRCVKDDQLFIANQNKYLTKKIYAIGDRGPAGGIIFFDKGDYLEGWRYIEVAPNDIGKFHFDCSGTFIGASSSAIGTGGDNTKLLLSKCNQNNGAAFACSQYNVNGFKDWVLPSKDELVLLRDVWYQNNGIGNFKEEFYWSSSESGKTSARGQPFFGGLADHMGKSDLYLVRPIRYL